MKPLPDLPPPQDQVSGLEVRLHAVIQPVWGSDKPRVPSTAGVPSVAVILSQLPQPPL